MVAIGYGTSARLSTIEAHFFDKHGPVRDCDLLLMRVSPRETGSGTTIIGAELHWEPDIPELPKHAIGLRLAEIPINGWFETTRFTHAPLSDLYYRLVQNAYYTIDARGFDFGNIGAQMMAYMAWGTYDSE